MRKPDFIIGDKAAPYLKRWWVIPRNRWFNIYLHNILRSDDDRARHDHPWWNISFVLKGGYWEDMPSATKWRGRFSFILRRPTDAHILKVDPLLAKDTWTLFITGPVVREWGFLCPKGWKHWRAFTKTVPGGSVIGEGC